MQHPDDDKSTPPHPEGIDDTDGKGSNQSRPPLPRRSTRRSSPPSGSSSASASPPGGSVQAGRVTRRRRPPVILDCPFANCSRQFRKESNRRTHMRVHTREEPYTCEYAGCGRSFRWKSSLNSHHRVHEKHELRAQRLEGEGVAGVGNAPIAVAAGGSGSHGISQGGVQGGSGRQGIGSGGMRMTCGLTSRQQPTRLPSFRDLAGGLDQQQRPHHTFPPSRSSPWSQPQQQQREEGSFRRQPVPMLPPIRRSTSHQHLDTSIHRRPTPTPTPSPLRAYHVDDDNGPPMPVEVGDLTPGPSASSTLSSRSPQDILPPPSSLNLSPSNIYPRRQYSSHTPSPTTQALQRTSFALPPRQQDLSRFVQVPPQLALSTRPRAGIPPPSSFGIPTTNVLAPQVREHHPEDHLQTTMPVTTPVQVVMTSRPSDGDQGRRMHHDDNRHWNNGKPSQ